MAASSSSRSIEYVAESLGLRGRIGRSADGDDLRRADQPQRGGHRAGILRAVELRAGHRPARDEPRRWPSRRPAARRRAAGCPWRNVDAAAQTRSNWRSRDDVAMARANGSASGCANCGESTTMTGAYWAASAATPLNADRRARARSTSPPVAPATDLANVKHDRLAAAKCCSIVLGDN